VRENSQVRSEIQITNRGKIELEIPSTPWTSCGCMVLRQQFPISIQPGKTFRLEVLTSVTDQDFTDSLRVLIRCKESNKTIVAPCEIVGSLPPSPTFAPSRLDFLFQNGELTCRREVFLCEVPGSPMEILDVSDSPGVLENKIQIESDSHGLKKIRIELSLAANRAEDVRNGTLQIRTSSIFRPLITIPFTATVERRLTF
jgi:hypothetical protein